jgi:hypothetical protein
MRPVSSATLRSSFLFLVLAVLGPLQGSWAQTACAYSLGGCQCSCDGLSSLPPQNPPPRSYDDFIIETYLGAYARFPTCPERNAEYWNLVNASYNGSVLLEEAKRFVSTRFETQQSYNIPGIDPSGYTQTPEYEQRNPAWQTDRVAIESFLTDLYDAFLQRSPDLGGQCFWSNNVCSEGRKKGIEAFKVSGEFGSLVSGLYAGDEPCPLVPDDGGGGPCSLEGHPALCR